MIWFFFFLKISFGRNNEIEIVISGKHLCAGSPSGNNLTPVGPCRYDSSLGNTTISILQ